MVQTHLVGRMESKRDACLLKVTCTWIHTRTVDQEVFVVLKFHG